MLISDADNWRGSVRRVDICLQAESPSADDQWSRALIDRERGYMQKQYSQL